MRIYSVLLLAGSVAQADTNFDEVVETMMNASIDDALFIQGAFGNDLATTLHFSSTLDPVALTFSYALLPGQTYLGQSIGLSLSGSYNSGLAQYDMAGSGYLGTNTWTEAGSITWEGDPEATINENHYLGNLGEIWKYTGKVTVYTDGISLLSTGVINIAVTRGQTIISNYNANVEDRKFPAGSWYVTGFITNQVASASGYTPDPNGGSGYFDVVIVPEPSTLVLLGLGSLGLLGHVWRRKPQGKVLEESRSGPKTV